MKSSFNIYQAKTAQCLQTDLDGYYDCIDVWLSGLCSGIKSTYLELGTIEYSISSVCYRCRECAFDDYRILTAIRHGYLGLQQLNVQIEKRLLQQLNQTKTW